MPDWDGLAGLVATSGPPESWDHAWSDIARGWMGKVRGRLGGGYAIRESTNFQLVSTAGEEKAVEVLQFLERVHARIRQTIPALLPGVLYGKCPVIVFADENDFYDYVSGYLDGDGEFYPDDGQELSYHLARFLLHALHQGGATPREEMDRFFLAAAHEDAGQAAAQEVFGVSLGDCLVPLLGEGPWEPLRD